MNGADDGNKMKFSENNTNRDEPGQVSLSNQNQIALEKQRSKSPMKDATVPARLSIMEL